MFMFLPGRRDVSITRMEFLFEAPDAEPGRPFQVELVTGHRRWCKHQGHSEERDVTCIASTEWPGRYRGAVDVHVGPLSWGERDLIASLRFPASHGTVRDLYVVCTYETDERPRVPAGPLEKRLPRGHAP
jgi:hypothetical protein